MEIHFGEELGGVEGDQVAVVVGGAGQVAQVPEVPGGLQGVEDVVRERELAE